VKNPENITEETKRKNRKTKKFFILSNLDMILTACQGFYEQFSQDKNILVLSKIAAFV